MRKERKKERKRESKKERKKEERKKAKMKKERKEKERKHLSYFYRPIHCHICWLICAYGIFYQLKEKHDGWIDFIHMGQKVIIVMFFRNYSKHYYGRVFLDRCFFP